MEKKGDQPQTDGAFILCRETRLLPKRIFDIFSHYHGLMRVDIAPNTALSTNSQGRKTAHVKFADAPSAQKAKDTVDGALICQHPLELTQTTPLDLNEAKGVKIDSWDQADQARWGRGNNALVASIMKFKFADFKILYNDEKSRMAELSPDDTALQRQKIVCRHFKYEVSISYHQLLENRSVIKSPQDLNLSQSTVSEHTLHTLLIDFRLFAARVENMRFLRTALQPEIDLPVRQDDALTNNLFMVGDYLAETNGSPEISAAFQDRMFRCLHDDLEAIYAGEVEVDELWEDIFEQAIGREKVAA